MKFSRSLLIRIQPDLRAKLVLAARRRDMGISELTRLAIEREITAASRVPAHGSEARP